MAIRGKTIVGTATAGQIRGAGFEVIMDATKRFPLHARLMHPEGLAGFIFENLNRISKCFVDEIGL
jgi:hypothetical protein